MMMSNVVVSIGSPPVLSNGQKKAPERCYSAGATWLGAGWAGANDPCAEHCYNKLVSGDGVPPGDGEIGTLIPFQPWGVLAP
jgi:hypothetical protein